MSNELSFLNTFAERANLDDFSCIEVGAPVNMDDFSCIEMA